jgi:uncharacterized protein YcbK (DUF882 family)
MTVALTALLSGPAGASRGVVGSGGPVPRVRVQARAWPLQAGLIGRSRTAAEVGWKSRTPASGRRPAAPALPTIELEHQTTHATYKLRADSPRGGFSGPKLRALAQLLRCHHTGKKHSISQRLIEILYATARHYHNAKLMIVAGYRAPQIARQKGNPRSAHKRGVACDFQVAGVSNEAVRDYLRQTYHKIGLGYYPKAGFVHVDVGRTKDAYWVDYSGPGQKARYGKADAPPAAEPEELAVAHAASETPARSGSAADENGEREAEPEPDPAL